MTKNKKILGPGSMLALLGLAQAISLMDRQILAILVPRMKEDFGVGNAEMGLLYGTVFAFFYAIFSLPLGKLVDNWNRTLLLGACLIFWSIMTALSGLTTLFWVLVIARLGIGIGEASAQPTSMSLISNIFEKKDHGIASSVLAAAVAIGLGVALWIGGTVSDYWDSINQHLSLIQLKGWQVSFLVASIPGLILGVLFLRVSEPMRRNNDQIQILDRQHPFRTSILTLLSLLPISAWIVRYRHGVAISKIGLNIFLFLGLNILAYVAAYFTNGLRTANPTLFNVLNISIDGNSLQWFTFFFGIYVLITWLESLKYSEIHVYKAITNSRLLQVILIVSSLQMLINYGVMGWTAAFVTTHFSQKPSDVGMRLGAIVAIIGSIGPLIAGIIGDKFESRFIGGRLIITLISLLISPVLMYGTYTANSIEQFYLMFILYSIILTMWLPGIYAALISSLNIDVRGTIMGLYVLMTTTFGLALGPYLVGILSDTNGNDIASAIITINFITPILIGLVIYSIHLTRMMTKYAK